MTTLPNGIRVVTEHRKEMSSTIGLWVDSGSRYEKEDQNGVAHFLEHLLFKGTWSRTQGDLEEGIENMGAHLNAYTSREQTAYFSKVMKGDEKEGLNILADILLNSKIAADSVDRERSVILREMEEIEGITEEVVFDYLHHTAYRGSSLSRTILGSKENIMSITRDDLVNYTKRMHTGSRIVVAGVGDMDHDKVVSWASELLSTIPTTASVEPIDKQNQKFIGSNYLHRIDDMPYAHFAYAFEVGGWNDPDTYALMVLQTMLSTYDPMVPFSEYYPSRLVNEIRQISSCQKMHPFMNLYSDTGLFGVYSVCGPYDAFNTICAVVDNITFLSYSIDGPNFQAAKKNLKANLLLSLDDTSATCDEIGRQVLSHGRRIHPSEVIARIDAVTADEAKSVAEKYFHDNDFALSAFGPIYELPDYNIIRSRTYSKLS